MITAPPPIIKYCQIFVNICDIISVNTNNKTNLSNGELQKDTSQKEHCIQ